jgi:hypothetical protein
VPAQRRRGRVDGGGDRQRRRRQRRRRVVNRDHGRTNVTGALECGTSTYARVESRTCMHGEDLGRQILAVDQRCRMGMVAPRVHYGCGPNLCVKEKRTKMKEGDEELGVGMPI